MKIFIASTDLEIAACYPVMSELRPHVTEGEFVSLVRHLSATTGLTLACLHADGEVRSVAGYRVSEWLAGGKYLEIEDLVSRSAERGKGYGGRLFDWLVELATREGCNHLRLVSNVSREDAHRFYLRKGMTIVAHYFSLDLDGNR